MNIYQKSIIAVTGCTEQEVSTVEEIMRKDVFASTLDWQTKEQFDAGAVEAYAIYKELVAAGIIEAPELTAEQKDKIEIFGEDFDVPQETLDAYAERCRLTGIEMDKFFDSLPAWIEDGEKFALWMKTDAERAEWIEANEPKEVPMEKSPYLKPSTNAKPVMVGRFRI